MTLENIRTKKPIVHCITNYVVANFTANGLLAVNASPIMADAAQEVEDIVSISDGLLINIGTLNERTVQSMLLAGKKANKQNKVVVLDPVGCGASSYRKQITEQLLLEVKFTMIRCNAGELAALCNIDTVSRGVDAGNVSFNMEEAAKTVAQKYHCIVAISGKSDFITDGVDSHYVAGGHHWMEQVTGSGCLLSALAVAALASSSTTALQAAYTLHQDYKKIASKAASNSTALGDFQIALLNELHKGDN